MPVVASSDRVISLGDTQALALIGTDPPLLTGIDPLNLSGVYRRARRGQTTRPQGKPVDSR
jgi:hypothetical protein